MNEKEKDLLIKDLCARLPYGLKYNYGGYDDCDCTMNRVDCNAVNCVFPIENVKPYLFPLSNMTEEKKIFLRCQNWCIAINTSGTVETTIEGFDWLNKNHFDYRGLIEKGLAIDATNLNIY